MERDEREGNYLEGGNVRSGMGEMCRKNGGSCMEEMWARGIEGMGRVVEKGR